MKHFLIYTNELKDKNLTVTKKMEQFLLEKGQRVTLTGINNTDSKEQAQKEALDYPKDIDCMLVLGGDGTVLQAARETRSLNIPLIGVNLGNLGFLTQIEPSGLEEALNRLIAGDYQTESRMMLRGDVFFSEKASSEGFALNDIVITRNGPIQIVKLKIYVNGKFLNEYNGDGVILTTPTGSTGYNLSAGGPLIEPGAQLLMLTPICPHTLNQRSIIFSSEDEIEIEIPLGKEGQIQNLVASFDGITNIPVSTGERIKVCKSTKSVQFIQLRQESFLEILNKKMSE